VDAAGFDAEMKAQKQRSKDAAKSVDLTAGAALGELVGSVGATSFLGYTQLESPARVVAILADGRPVDVASPGHYLPPASYSPPVLGFSTLSCDAGCPAPFFPSPL
jgi:alanyl-tRNA synthetase